MERECVEERCSKEEAREVFENDPETVSGNILSLFSMANVRFLSLTLHDMGFILEEIVNTWQIVQFILSASCRND